MEGYIITTKQNGNAINLTVGNVKWYPTYGEKFGDI